MARRSGKGSQEADAEELRLRLTEFMNSKKLTVTGWTKRAGVTEGALRAFLGRRSKTLTHATLLALANAAQEPVAALLAGKSIWGNTVRIEVAAEVNATKERTTEFVRTSLEAKYRIQVPMALPEEIYFGAEVGDDSVSDKWGVGSILICAEFGWNGAFDVLCDGDFLILQEKRTQFEPDVGAHKEYFKITARQLVTNSGENFLVMRSDNPRFHGSIPIHSLIIGTVVERPIPVGLGSEINILGKVVASFSLEPNSHLPVT